MIGQYLSNTNEIATVLILPKILDVMNVICHFFLPWLSHVRECTFFSPLV